MDRQRMFFLLTSCLLLLAAPAWGQADGLHAPQGVAAAAQPAPPSVVLRVPSLSVRDVGAALVNTGARHAFVVEQYSVSKSAVEPVAERQEAVTTAEFKRGAVIGGAAGFATGALVGALLGGGRSQRIETAVPGALTGLAVGAPIGVYVQTGRTSRYLWGAAGVVGVVAAGAAVFVAEAY